MKVPFSLLSAFLLTALFLSCQSGQKASEEAKEEDQGNDFKAVNGIRFYEVKRRFNNGLSFNKNGFQQEPTWIIEYQAPDTMRAYSPEKNGMEHFFLQYDHGKVYNFAREFFRVITVHPDSLVLQRLEVSGRHIESDERSDVFCTFYTRDFIENKLKTTIGELQRPSAADTSFIRGLADQTLKDPSNPDIAFAARQPVVLLPNSKHVKVEKISTADDLNKRKASVDYLYPYYKIEINKSYKDFHFSFSVIVDARGKMYVNRVDGVMKDDVKHRKKLLEGITEVYLQNLFHIQPGRTLGFPHSSEINLTVTGKKN